MSNKYDPLRKYLLAVQENILECTLSFSGIVQRPNNAA